MAQILILEEDKRQFQMIKQCVEAKGHKTFWTSKTHEAVQLLNRFNFDLVISAVKLESGDVFDFLRQLNSSEQFRDLPVVFCCADQDRIARFANPVVTAAGLSLGVRKYILLPDFNAADQLWNELKDCLPEGVPAKDVLGGHVKTYSLASLSWSPSAERRAS
jgi:CheY-like chemotaxis protein